MLYNLYDAINIMFVGVVLYDEISRTVMCWCTLPNNARADQELARQHELDSHMHLTTG